MAGQQLVLHCINAPASVARDLALFVPFIGQGRVLYEETNKQAEKGGIYVLFNCFPAHFADQNVFWRDCLVFCVGNSFECVFAWLRVRPLILVPVRLRSDAEAKNLQGVTAALLCVLYPLLRGHVTVGGLADRLQSRICEIAELSFGHSRTTALDAVLSAVSLSARRPNSSEIQGSFFVFGGIRVPHADLNEHVFCALANRFPGKHTSLNACNIAHYLELCANVKPTRDFEFGALVTGDRSADMLAELIQEAVTAGCEKEGLEFVAEMRRMLNLDQQ